MQKNTPLAERFRPKSFDDFVGQEHLIGEGCLLRRAIEEDKFGSCIFWGPPGCGKTSLAKVIANMTEKRFVSFSAVLNGVKEIREVVEQAKDYISAYGQGTILFIDEIHRFNKSQQDALLPHVESGMLLLIGATTENPSFEINSALLSRCQVFVLKALDDKNIAEIIGRVIYDNERGLGSLNIKMDEETFNRLVNYSNGDVRTALNALEWAANSTKANDDGFRQILLKTIEQAIMNRKIAYDKGGEEHYNLISAVHKSLRGSDPQAALYWLARMIEGGADPLYIARRLVRFASEDIGLADPNALVQANAAKDAVHFLGLPECDAALAQCVVYLATAPKSNSAYKAISSAKASVNETKNEPVPLHIRNAPTKLMKDIGYGDGYEHDHAFLPESIDGVEFYQPGPYGFEKDIKKRMEYWDKLKRTIRES